tara:strand:- start:93 stop:227 length:135 start_codon:yes stop_codon:yes gene_type:complete
MANYDHWLWGENTLREDTVNRILTEGWNYLALEERELDEGLQKD